MIQALQYGSFKTYNNYFIHIKHNFPKSVQIMTWSFQVTIHNIYNYIKVSTHLLTKYFLMSIYTHIFYHVQYLYSISKDFSVPLLCKVFPIINKASMHITSQYFPWFIHTVIESWICQKLWTIYFVKFWISTYVTLPNIHIKHPRYLKTYNLPLNSSEYLALLSNVQITFQF